MDASAPSPKQEVARRLPRHETDNRVVLTVPKPNGPQMVRGRASNISEAGFGAVLAGELEVGTVVHAKLMLVSLTGPLELEARVMNRHGFTHGFQFVAITPEQRRKVTRYLKSAAQDELMTQAEADAMNQQHAAEPHGMTGRYRFSPDAWEKKPEDSVKKDEKNSDGGE
jgi:hypothetical protein